MERTRSISLTLIFLSLILGSNIRNIADLSTQDYILLGAIIVVPHLVGMAVSSNKFLQNISPILSAFLGLEILLFRAGGNKLEKILPSLHNLKNLSKQGKIGISQFENQIVPLKSSTAIIIVIAFILWAISELIETISKRLHLYGTAFALYIIFFAISTAIAKNEFEPITISLFCIGSWLYLRATYQFKISTSAHKININSKTRYTILAKNTLLLLIVVGACISIVLPISKVPSIKIIPDDFLNNFVHKSSKTELSPLVSMRAQLKNQKNILLFTAQTDSAQYFRIGVLNNFNGDTWSYSSPDKNIKEPEIVNRSSTSTKASFDIKNLEPKFLPTIYNTDSASSRELEVLSDSTIYANKGNVTSYSINASIPSDVFTEEQIVNGSKKTPKELEDYLLIPKDFDPKIEELTRQIASNKSSIYDQVTALRDYFTKGDFTYSTDVKYTSSQKSMSQFLEKRIGFCEQFASTYAAMARSIRIPARVVIGFTPGIPDSNGVFNIMSKQAHSWVEVYLTDIGWITIDPTPQGDLPGQAPSNIGEVVPTTTSSTTTTIQESTSSSTPISEPTSSTLQKVPVTKNNENESTSSIFSFTNLMIFVFLMIFGGCIFVFRILKKKSNIKPPITIIHNTFQKVLLHFAPEKNKLNVTIAEAKTLVPKDCLLTQRFLDQYSDFSYAPDSDIDITDLTSSAHDALEEIDDKEKISS